MIDTSTARRAFVILYGHHQASWFASSVHRQRVLDIMEGRETGPWPLDDIDLLMWQVMPEWMQPAVPIDAREPGALQRHIERNAAEGVMYARLAAAAEDERRVARAGR